MLYWIYELPTVAVVGVFAALFVAICWVATILSRPIVQTRIHRPSGLNELVGDFMQYFGVIYGLLLGLLAVATYQNYAEVENTVENEASSLAALYRDVSSYPEPKRSELEAILRDYTRYVIDEAWPLQRKGIVPAGAVKKVADFQASLVGFEPQTKSQEALHDAALKQFNTFYEYRRARLHSVTSSIPAVMWYTVAVGALLNILLLLLFDLRLGIHLLLGGILVFSGDLNLADRVDGSPFSRRNERVTHSIPTCLRSGDETVTSVGGEDRYGRSRLTRLNAPFSAVFCDQATIEFTRYAWIVPPTEWIW